MEEGKKRIFSGHESFECRRFWLKKGYDHIVAGNKFNDEAGILLGVGRNMVPSIRYWMRAYGLLNESDNLTEFARLIFNSDGLDPYLEDEATLWLLHYKLVSVKYAAIYDIIFNDFRKQKPEFSKEQLALYILTNYKQDVNEATFTKDFEAFTKTYIPKSDDVEENFEGILTELNLVSEHKYNKGKEKRFFVIEPTDKKEIPVEVILYCLLSRYEGNSISFENAFADDSSVGVVFAMTKQGLSNKLDAIASEFGAVYSDNAGIRELQFKNRPNPIKVLKQYYQAYVG